MPIRTIYGCKKRNTRTKIEKCKYFFNTASYLSDIHIRTVYPNIIEEEYLSFKCMNLYIYIEMDR